MRNFCCIIACLFGGAIAAETIGNVEFQFPPSTHDWVLLTDASTLLDLEEDDNSFKMRIYTHKAGDALEFFTATYIEELDEEEDDEEEEDPSQTSDMVQSFLNEIMSASFPNHRINISQLTETDEDGFLEWSMDDGFQPIFQGLSRYLKADNSIVILTYMTTGSQDSLNTSLWTEVLYEAEAVN